MKTYISAGIGDFIAADALLTQEERDKITEIYWACRFGPCLVPLLENNPFYPNLKSQYTIDDHAGMNAMRQVDSNCLDFWHFRPDFGHNRQVGLSLFGVSESEMNFLDIAAMFQSDRKFTNSSFLDAVRQQPMNWGQIPPHDEYILFHYPTSTRPRSDIASINDADWRLINNLSKDKNLPVVMVTDSNVTPLLDNVTVLIKPELRSVMRLCLNASFYVGTDSFCAILCSKFMKPEQLFVKSPRDMRQEIFTNVWQQKYFAPHSPEDISKFWKPFL